LTIRSALQYRAHKDWTFSATVPLDERLGRYEILDPIGAGGMGVQELSYVGEAVTELKLLDDTVIDVASNLRRRDPGGPRRLADQPGAGARPGRVGRNAMG
jgi:hypothetical protein